MSTSYERMSHTRGPWRAEKGAPGGHPDVYSVFAELGDHSYETVAHVSTRFTGTMERIDPAVIEANARLIAAAPELLSALKEARDYVLTAGTEKDMAPVIETIDRAIAKAEGRS